MPGWSPEIANEFIALSVEGRQPLDQLQLQGLVYIAHGWCLALDDRPLTGDRPEALPFGPAYERLAKALASYGRRHVTHSILRREAFGKTTHEPDRPALSELDQFEIEMIRDVFHKYGSFDSWQLSALTRKGDTPWAQIFEDGAGQSRDIPHQLIRAQFVELLRQSQPSRRNPTSA